MEPFATVADYKSRYGAGEDDARLSALLGDASTMIASQPALEILEADERQSANLRRITCAVAARSLSAGDLAGIENYSQGAIGLTATVKPFNPSGDMYLTKSELRALGLTGGRVGQTDPYGQPS